MSNAAENSYGFLDARFFRFIFQSLKLLLVFIAIIICLGSEYFHRLPIRNKFLTEIRDEVFGPVQAFDTQLMVMVCVAVWCGTFLLLTFSQKDWLLIVFLLLAIISHFIRQSTLPTTGAITLLFGVTLGKSAFVLLRRDKGENNLEFQIPNSKFRIFLTGLIVLLAFSAWWQLDMTDNFYHGPRWMGLWDNPNTYGMLMGAGLLLAMGMLAGRQNEEGRSQKSEVRMKKITAVFLFIAAGMMGVGLVCSYSRGAWAGAVIGLLYLAKVYGKFKWRYLLPVLFITAAVICFCCWNTPDSSPWYVKRLDLSRGSVTHRLAAWRGALQMMRDHPLGVGWNKAIEIYANNYSPPANGALALDTNDYLMLGTQLGFPGVLCFVAYVGLCFRNKFRIPNSEFRIQAACRAGALALLVTFWFDGGLFELATAAVFWILLELGRSEEPPPSASSRRRLQGIAA